MFQHLSFGLFLLIVPLGAAAAGDASNLLGDLPIHFIENRGQVPADEVAYYVKGSDRTLFFTPEGVTFAMACKGNQDAERWAVKLGFIGANRDVVIAAKEKRKAVFSYFKGKPAEWKTGIPAYGKLVYEDLWPGIDLVYSGNVNELKYDFVVAPGADPACIRLEYGGIEDAVISESGNLVVNTPAGALEDCAPVAFQVVDGRKVEVRARFVLHGEAEGGTVSYGFDVGDYDPDEPLILDPSMIIYCGFIGGDGNERSAGIAVDGQGNAYLTGWTDSTETTFPVTFGPGYGGGDYDVFVAKINAQGTGLDYCGYIGGERTDYGMGIAVDDHGNAYVTGSTWSSEATFPVQVGPDLTQNGYYFDAFVAKINAQGTGLVYCGYIGGDESDSGAGIAVDDHGNAYVAGQTESTEATFPVVVGPDLTYNGGILDAFVAKVNVQGTALDYCGYIGGAKKEYCHGIALDSQGNAYITGHTRSKRPTFPVAVGPDLTYNGGYYDAFVARIAAGGATLDYCGYIGGDNDDFAYGITVDGQENAYVTGMTRSSEASFPVLVGPDLTYNGGYYDAFVARIAAGGATLDYCGYIGGDGEFDSGIGIAVDGMGNAYVCGDTDSGESSFPVLVGPDLTHSGDTYETFVAKINAQGAGFDYCGYIGGNGSDVSGGIAVDGQGNAYVTGHTGSSLTFPVCIGPDLSHNGGVLDAFVAKLGAFDAPVPDIKVNGDDGPLNLTTLDTVTVTIHLDPRSLDGEPADWWVAARKGSSSKWWAKYRAGQMPEWTNTALPVRFVGTKLRSVGTYTVLGPRTLPAGEWVFGFSVDGNIDNIYDKSYFDTVTVTVN